MSLSDKEFGSLGNDNNNGDYINNGNYGENGDGGNSGWVLPVVLSIVGIVVVAGVL